MKKIVISAPAKINLHLEVLDRLENGYHNIETIMQTVSLSDTVIAEKCDSDNFVFFCSEPSLPQNEENIAFSAALAFFEAFNISDRGVRIVIEKNIPIAAGLAGGSTDAAAVLIALNELYGCGADIDKLCKIAASLGADVPFCVKKGTTLAGGIGNRFIPCGNLPDCYITIALGKNRVSTKWAYEQLDIRARELKSVTPIFKALEIGDVDAISSKLYNTFEILSPESAVIKSKMLDFGATGTLMSGSGPSVFGIFKREQDAESAKLKLINDGYDAFVCKPVYS